MEQEQDYFNLEQVAEECGLSVEAVKDRIFEGDLTPSFQINRPTRANLYTETTPPNDSDDYPFSETVLLEPNVSFTGIVYVYSLKGFRNSGRFEGRIELHPNHWRKTGSLDDPLFQPSLYHRTESGMLVQLELLESCEVPENKLKVHSKHLSDFKSKDATEITPTADQAKKENAGEFNLQNVLPIRFIEFYTGGNLGPETTSLLFAHKQGIDWNRRMEEADKLTAYHWQLGKLTPLKRTEWELILHSIKSLSERFNKTDKHFDEWRTAALKILPVAFVRRSEFDAAYHRAMSTERITFVDQSRGFERLTGDEDKEARETNDTPYIPPELRKLVFEGFEQEETATSHEVTAPKQASTRHVITEDERKAKRKSAIQLAVEAYLNTTPDGNKAAYYTFLKKQIKLPNEAILKDGQSYAYFFDEVKEKGSQEGVYLTHPKEGKKEGEAGWNHYSGSAVSGIISKERNIRKRLLPEK